MNTNNKKRILDYELFERLLLEDLKILENKELQTIKKLSLEFNKNKKLEKNLVGISLVK